MPPSPQQAYQMAKVLSWLDRNKTTPSGPAVDTTSMSPLGHTFLITAVIVCLSNWHRTLLLFISLKCSAIVLYELFCDILFWLQILLACDRRTIRRNWSLSC